MSISEKIRAALAADPTLAKLETAAAVDTLALSPGFEGVKRETLRRLFQRNRAAEVIEEGDGGYFYRFDEAGECYTIQAGELRLEGVPSKDVQELVQWHVYAGVRRLTQSQIAKESWTQHKRALTRSQVAAVFRALNVTKGSLPLAPHEYSLGAESAAKRVREAVEADAERLWRADEAKSWKTIARKAQRELANVEDLISKYTEGIEPLIPRGLERAFQQLAGRLEGSLESIELVVFLSDWHAGAAHKEVFGEYNRTVFERRVAQLSEDICDHIRRSGRTISKLHMVSGGDMVEGVLEMRRGHYLSQDVLEGQQVKLASKAFAGVAQDVGEVAGVEPHMWGVGGNHDRAGGDRSYDPNRVIAQIFYDMVHAYYGRELEGEHAAQDTTIHFPVADGLGLVIVQHGDQSPRDIKDIVEHYRCTGAQWFLILSGHLHHLRIVEGSHCLSVQCPSLMGPENYGVKRLGKGARPGQVLIEIHEVGPRPFYLPLR